MVLETIISKIETSIVGFREPSRETTLEIEVENPKIEPSPSISSMDLETPPGWVSLTLFGNNMDDEEERDSNAEQPWDEVTFGFHVLDLESIVTMKNTHHSVLPQFHGMVTKDPNSFLFEFHILWHSYNYVNDGKI